MKPHRIVASLMLALLTFGIAAHADEITADSLKSRLNLTPEQQSQIAPLVDEWKGQMQDVRAKLASATARSDKRAAFQEARAAGEKFNAGVTPILTPDQQAEWQKIRSEMREQAKERWKGMRQGGGGES